MTDRASSFGILLPIALGLASIGTFAFGLIAIGVLAFGLFTLGTLVIGQFSVGALAIAKYAAIGASAKAQIAISNDTGKALGDVFSKCGELSEADKGFINAWLDDNVPGILALFKSIFKLFVG